MIDEGNPHVPEQAPPSVAVLLAAFQGAQFIEEQLCSILEQRDVTVQVFVSVDRSTDGTEQLLDQRAEVEDRLTLLPHGGHFGAAAPNFYRLLLDTDFSDYDYVAFADQDDVWLPWKLSRAVLEIERVGAVGYSSNVYEWIPGATPKPLRKSNAQRRWDHLFSSPGPGCTHVLTSDFAQQLRELIAEKQDAICQVEYHDWLDYAYARTLGLAWTIDEKPTMLYRQHSSNQLGANSGVEAIRKRARALREGWLWDQAQLVGTVTGAESEYPLQLLRNPSLRDRLKFVRCARETRRRAPEAAALALAALTFRAAK